MKIHNYPAEKPEGIRPVFGQDESGEWLDVWYKTGYWFHGNSEFDGKIVKWFYRDEIEEKIEAETPVGEALRKVIQNIERWHYDRNLIEGSDPKSQYLKLISEAGELGDNIAKSKDVRDDIGDMAVVLILIALQSDTNILECLEIAYEDIKDRKGRMVNGVFVKEQD